MFEFRPRVLTLVFTAFCVLCAAPLFAYDALSFTVRGADDDLRDELRAASLVVTLQGDISKTSRDILAASQADYARLLGVLYGRGRYSGVIRIRLNGREASTIPTFSVPKVIQQVSVEVEPGPVFRLGSARAAPLAPGTALPEGFRRGAVAESLVLQETADAGVDGWRDVGHAKARLEAQRITANHASQQLNADLSFAPGPQVRFGNLVLQRESAVRPDRIRRIAGLPVGEVFSPDELDKAATRLRRTGAFSSVALREAETLGPNNTMDINLTVADQKPRRFEFGAELSSIEGLTLSGAWIHRNLLGGAERLRFDAEVAGIAGETGGIDYTIDGRFEIPAAFGTDTKAIFTGKLAYEDEPSFTSSRIELGAAWAKIFSDTFEAQLGVGLRFSETQDAMGTRTFSLLTLPASATWDTRDDPLSATNGYYLYADATPFVEMRDAATGLRLNADARAYRAIGGARDVVLAGRLQLGSVVSSDSASVPPDFLYFSGGGGTVRGQGYQSLGISSGGGTVGGESFLGGSAEVRVGLGEKFGLVGFVDAGLIGADSTWGGGDWHAGAGLGVRYKTIVGPIRFDLAVPLRRNAGGGVQFYIGIGEAF
ncbi:BamA/TamA family outer membrane protein [Cognatishimia sp. SS12]|uniref:autotransporter assembly complex protein TamA n=1 Tax=Cognatishimia sp. SS12 TaxID=2979465 RepID=UPI002330CC3A|nr:BamA/TamA family outer membrane protein [Cognatishimia sp. SS12]MDC0739413.1 BamA/TamA family outer membrane protein [Cognatishimia sp. SS12]